MEKPILRWTVALAGVGILCSWALLHYGRASRLSAWQSRDWEVRYGDVLQDPASVPPRTAALTEAADFFSREIMPPDRVRARALLVRALMLTPLSSPLWLALAEQDIFLGQHEEARAALLHADSLDPSYPDQRLAAVQLWTLLGDRERAMALGRRIAALDAAGRDEAAQALLRAGFSGDEIMRELHLETLAPKELTGVLMVLANASPEKQREMMAKLPDSTLDDAAFRQSAAQAFSNPPDPAIVRKLWERQKPSLQSVRVADAEILVDNLGIEESPLEGNFWFGWQGLPDGSAADAFWLTRTQTPEDFPQVRIDFSSAYERDSRSFRWIFYRLPVPPLTKPLTIEVPLRSVPPEFSRCRLAVRHRTEIYPGPEYLSATPGWGSLRATVPPSDKPRLLEFALERQRRGNARAHEVSLFLGPIKIGTATAEDVKR